MSDLIDRQAAINAIEQMQLPIMRSDLLHEQFIFQGLSEALAAIKELPSAQPTLYGYNINQLALIARILQKENLPPERVTEALSDMGSIIAMAYDEFMESLRKVFEQDGFEQ